VSVNIIVGSLVAGMSNADIACEYGVADEDVCAALEAAPFLKGREQHHPLPR